MMITRKVREHEEAEKIIKLLYEIEDDGQFRMAI